MIVVDASAITELLLRTDLGTRVEKRLFRSSATWHAPHLLDVEVLQALRSLARRGTVDAGRAAEAMEDLGLLGVVRHPHGDLLPRAWSLRGDLTAYDAVYVALAESLGSVLVTCDVALASAPGNAARIEAIR